MSLSKKILTILSGIFGIITLYFGCVGLGGALEFWIWRTCTRDAVELHLIKPLYGSAIALFAVALAVWWLYERSNIDYTRLYSDINYGTV